MIPSRNGSRYDAVSEELATPAYSRRKMLPYDSDVRGSVRRESARDTAAEPQNENSLF